MKYTDPYHLIFPGGSMLKRVIISLTEPLCKHVPGRDNSLWYWLYTDLVTAQGRKAGFTLSCMMCGAKIVLPPFEVPTMIVVHRPIPENIPVCHEQDEPGPKQPVIGQRPQPIPHSREMTLFDKRFFQEHHILFEKGPLVKDEQEEPR